MIHKDNDRESHSFSRVQVAREDLLRLLPLLWDKGSSPLFGDDGQGSEDVSSLRAAWGALQVSLKVATTLPVNSGLWFKA